MPWPVVSLGRMTDIPLHKPVHHVYYGHDRRSCQVQLEDGNRVEAKIRSEDRDVAGRWSPASPGPSAPDSPRDWTGSVQSTCDLTSARAPATAHADPRCRLNSR